MKSHVKVAVIGGGVVGCSVLYHLAKLGWTDIALIERSELTSGSTWHAAGGFHTINADTNMAALQGYTIKLYKELEELSGQSCGLHHVGGITMAGTADRMDYLKAERAKHRYMGLDTHLVTPEEIKELSPITNVEGIIGGLYDPLDGHLDPSGTTHAYAQCARKLGAEIYLRNPVLELNHQPDGSWKVVTKDGTIHAEHVVNAGGLWARELGEMVGIFLPLHPMEHQYLITEDIPEIVDLGREHPHVMDPEGESYLRQEGRGICIGFYEQDCDPWAVRGTPLDFGHELLPNKLDRIGDSMEFAFNRFPVLQKAGIKNVINGPFTFAPDGNPLVGPVPGLKNYWSACAVMAGFSQGGGVGLILAEWMIEGEPSRDVFAMDVARYGDYSSRAYARKKVTENYQRRFNVSYPNEELPAARPFKTTPAYNIWKTQRAVFGQAYGMEAVNYFAPEGEPLYETPSFRRSNAFDAIGEECRAVRNAVGITEIHNFGKYKVTGPGAADWLDMIMAGRIPKVGRLSLSPMLSPKGKLIGDFTIARLGEEEFQLTASYGAQAYHLRWFWDHLPDQGVVIENISLDRIGFQIAGPRARDLLAKTTDEDVSTAAFPFMSIKRMEVGLSDAIVQRVTYTGDLGYEIYVPADEQTALYETLAAAGAEFGLRPFGMRAMMSLRLEKSFGSWLREYKPDYTPEETGMGRFVAYNKPVDFIGKAAVLKDKAEGIKRQLCTFVVDVLDADVWADEPIWKDGAVVGFVTSGGYAHYVEKSVALGFVPPDMVAEGAEFEIEILGEMRPAKLVIDPLLDPSASRMRG
jgi:dimethylglycine dehydrogenase